LFVSEKAGAAGEAAARGLQRPKFRAFTRSWEPARRAFERLGKIFDAAGSRVLTGFSALYIGLALSR